MTEEERHARLIEAQDKAYGYATSAEGTRFLDDESDLQMANMWANVARSLRKDRV